MKRTILFSALLGLLFPLGLFANGDPVIAFSAFVRSSNPVPLKIKEVEVVSEDLVVVPEFPYTSVAVKYVLRNTSGKDFPSIDYGFPIDYSGEIGPSYFTDDYLSESLYECGGAGNYLKDIHFLLGGKELEWTAADEVVEAASKEYDEEMGEWIHNPQSSRLWTYTRISIPAGATVTLEVKYKVMVPSTSPLYHLAGSYLSRYYPSGGDLFYDFAPAKHWGGGKCGTLSVTVDCTKLDPIFKFKGDMESPMVSGLDFKRNGDVYSCREENFDFEDAEPLKVFMWYDYDKVQTEPVWGDPFGRCQVAKDAYSLKVSGSQSSYPAGNLSDGDLSTAWVAPGDGVGSIIDIDFSSPTPVSDLILYNGYQKSPSLLAANSMISQMRLEVLRADGTWDGSVEIDAISPFSQGAALFPYSESPFCGQMLVIPLVSIYRMTFGRNKGFDDDGSVVLEKVDPKDDYVKHVRITVLESRKGSKYTDLCVSEIKVMNAFQ